jgi:hypothetical protein
MDKKEYQKEYYEKNKVKISNRAKEYYHDNKETINENRREVVNQKMTEHYKNKPKKRKLYSETKEKQKEYRRKRMANDPLYKLKSRIRNLICNSFKKNGMVKKDKSFGILGCTPEFFIDYIQSKFSEGMTIENHGLWHLDHIIPLASVTDVETLIKLNHYTNLQPLWAVDNLKKGCKG